MDDWRSGISDLFATKEAEEAEQQRQKQEAGTGVISYFRDVVEPVRSMKSRRKSKVNRTARSIAELTPTARNTVRAASR